jgi:uncharacterized protein involved in exopolysaccharide biosynthesis
MAKYLEILFRQRLRFAVLLLLPVVLGVSAAVVLAGYRATATLRIADPSAIGPSFEPVGWSPNQTPAQNLADNVSQVVKTPAFSQSLSTRLTGSGAVSSGPELQQTLKSTSTGLKAVASGSHFVTLTYTCPHAAVCLAVVSDTIDIFKEEMAAIQQDQATAATTFWSGQLKDAQANLAAAQVELQNYASAHPGTTADAGLSDPQMALLVSNVQLWRGKVTEAQNSLSQAQYLGNASTRFLQIGTAVVDPPHMAGSRFVGDYSSLLPAALVLLVGLAAVAAYIFLLGWADRTAGDPKLLERRLGVPVVATIPKLVGSGGA